MALSDLLALSDSNKKKIGLSEERVKAVLPEMGKYIGFWREYPDLFFDYMQDGGDPTRERPIKLFFYQRVFLRVCMRYRYVYMVFPRAYSKSFLSVLTLMIRCILYPGAKLFVTAGGKEQGAGILKEKLHEICDRIPAFEREINWSRGKTKEGKDRCIYVFKNGSVLDNIAARESSRGLRRHGGLVEECAGVDGEILNTVIIPTMAVDRPCKDGVVRPDETLNKSQIFVTTAGYKNSFSYEKLITLLIRMVLEPEKSFVMGGTWRIPVMVGLQSRTFIQDQKQDGTFNEVSFGREYESKWAGSVADAFFDGEMFDKKRRIQKPEYSANGRNGTQEYYVISVDVGRKGCASVATVIKVKPQSQGYDIKDIVNIEESVDAHFEDQCIWLKKLYYKYKARRLVIDGNGLGIGLLDYMVKDQTDPITGDFLPNFGIYNDEENYYKKFQTDVTEHNAIYVIKANAPINTEAHANLQTLLLAGKINFLIDERTAKNKLLGTTLGQKMSPEERKEYLMPYQLTSSLKEELMNLRQENEGVNIILKQANKNIPKDKFSSLEYGLYYIKNEEENRKRRKKPRDLKKWKFYSTC